jgi:uncharacterized membrane protein
MSHLWAVGYDDMTRADQVRDHIARLGERHCLVLLNAAVAVCYPDGSFTLDGEPFVAVVNKPGGALARLLAVLALGAPPLTSAAVGARCRAAGIASPSAAGIDEDFVSEVARVVKPGTSALFVLDQVGDMDAILQGIQGLGGTVLKTNVDLDRARLIQAVLAAAPPPPSQGATAASPS